MNWKERFRPRNVTEAGCLVFLAAIPFLGVAIFLGVLDYIPYIAMGSWLIFYAMRFGFQAHTAYEVPKRTAVIISGILVLAYFLLWLGILVALAFGFSDFINQVNNWLFFIFGIALAIGMYIHLIRFKQTVYEKWFGWQPKDADGQR